MADGRPDIIAAVITADGTWSGASGIDGPDGKSASVSDEFAIASVSKLFLAATVMRLAEQGKIDLDQPLDTYLTTFGLSANGATVREALAMRSGIGDTSATVLAALYSDCARIWTQADVAATIPKPFASPDRFTHYSNPTYKLLGYAVNQATGTSLASAISSEVLMPAGVEDRVLLQGPEMKTPKPWALPLEGHTGNVALDSFGVGDALPCMADSTASFGAAGMAADVTSLARWGWELFGGRIVTAASLQQMLPAFDYGLGMESWPNELGAPTYGHSGNKPGYKTILAYQPSAGTIVALMVNDGDVDEIFAARGLLETLTQ